MSTIKIQLDENYYLSASLSEKDVDSLVKYMNDDVIYNNTLKIPKEYTKEKGL